jgi:lipoprotein-releasing system permease protein
MVAIMSITFAFIVVLSVFNGFEGLVKSLYSSFYPDIRISPKVGNKTIVITPEQLQKIKSVKDVVHYSQVVQEKTLLINGDVQAPVELKGVEDSYRKVTGVADKLIRGQYAIGTADKPVIVLGNGVEGALVLESDKNIYPITAYIFKGGNESANAADLYQSVSIENIVTVGTFLIQADIDNKYAITNIGFMRRMMALKDNECSAIEIALTNESKGDAVSKNLKKLLGDNYVVETKYEQNKSLYSVMNLEKWAIYAILSLMLIVAAFTMIGGLTMLVLEKQKDIQVLKAMGANNRLIQRIFLSEGLLLAAIGAVTGILLAIAFCWAQVRYKLIPLEGGTFLIDYYPVKLVWGDFILVIATVSIVALTASWFPSRKAALQPIELKS